MPTKSDNKNYCMKKESRDFWAGLERIREETEYIIGIIRIQRELKRIRSKGRGSEGYGGVGEERS